MAGFTPKQIAEQKLKAFSIGTMGKSNRLTRKEEEEKRRREEEARIGNVYKEFEEHFDDKPTSKINKTWVKAGTFNAGSRKEDTAGKGQLYKPTSKLAELADTFSSKRKIEEEQQLQQHAASSSSSSRRSDSYRPEKPGAKKKGPNDKKKSNLEIFKEELKAIQEEREERHKYKAMIKAGGAPIPGRSLLDIPPGGGALGIGDTLADVNGDPSSTNIYLGNISPKLSELQLSQLFGRYGPLASVKIMYPRTEEERSRGKNCGFVAYMSRADGERAMAALLGKNIEGHEMRMGWGKPVALPLIPIYIPPALMKYTNPPPATGLPFNCQPDVKRGDARRYGLAAGSRDNPRPCEVPPVAAKRERRKFDAMLNRAVVRVVIPTDRTQLCIINRMVEFVVREGPIFEATIMNRELNNPAFRFLFENQSPEHIYYRWRMFSILQGDTKDNWSTKDFRLFKGGSLWRPPIPNLFTSGMPAHLLDGEGASIDPVDDEEYDDGGGGMSGGGGGGRIDTPPRSSSAANKPPAVVLPGKRPLTDSQRDRLESTLRSLLPDRNGIAEAMVWCIEHADSGEEVVECLAESLSILETPVVKKIARLFLISDILHNCTVKGIPNVSFYRTGFQAKLPEIFADLNAAYQKVPSRMKAEAFKQRVMACFRAWEDWALYPMDFLIKLQNIFLGLVSTKEVEEEEEEEEEEEDEDVDGVPLDGAALLKGGRPHNAALVKQPVAQSVLLRPDSGSEESLDGEPLGRGPAGSPPPPTARGAPSGGGFMASKWETVDPEQVKAQAVTTSKWEREEADDLVKARKALMGAVASKWEDNDDDSLDGEPIDGGVVAPPQDSRAEEERRQILREIEVKVMRYQDELESGDKGIKSGWSIADQVEHYRKKLLKKSLDSGSGANLTPLTPAGSGANKRGGGGASSSTQRRRDNTGSRRSSGEYSDEGELMDDDDARTPSSSRRGSRKEKKKKKNRDRSSSHDSSPASRSAAKKQRRGGRDRSRSGDSSPGGGDRRRRSRSRSGGKRSKRSRSRSPSRKHKKKRH